MKNSLYLNLNSNLIINQNLRYAISLLNMNNYELAEEIRNLSEENICIEFTQNDDIFYKRYTQNHYSISHQEDYRYQILQEFRMQSNDYNEYKIAKYIIFSLDDKGFLTEDLEYFSNKIKVEITKVKEITKKIQHLSIPGLSCRSIKEFLILQANETNLRKFIDLWYEKILKFDFDFLIKNSSVSHKEIKDYISKIRKLKLYPLEDINNIKLVENERIDLVVNFNEELEIYINEIFTFEVKTDYIEMISKLNNEDSNFILNCYKKAKFIKNAIEIRNKNIIKVTKAIANYQKSHLKDGNDLKLLNMSMIAEITNLSISTVSRVVCNKNIYCEGRTIPLRSLFTSGITNGIEFFSSEYIKTYIKHLIKNENIKVCYTDKELTKKLNEQGIPINRRTVNKYRRQLNIPESRLRKKMYLIFKI